MSRAGAHRFVVVLTVFLVALVPRAIYPVSRPTQWYTRSVQFIHDVSHSDWSATVYSEHPGVTTMWLSGIALRLAGVTPELTPEGAYVDPTSLTARESAIGVLPLAVVIAAAIALAYVMLLRLFSPLASISAAMLVALDPFLLANSKVLHVDGLLAAFSLASALALLVFVRHRRLVWLAASGALGGLALLTKSPALFLMPFVALCLGFDALIDWRFRWGGAVAAGLGWLGIACLVYVVLYPAMWVDPLGTLRTVYSRAAMRLEWAHPSPLYFLGQPVVGDPGPAYYVVAWGCKLSAVVTVFAPLSVLLAASARGGDREQRISVGLLSAFAVFFTLQMMIGAKKLPRYILPAFPVVDVLAGVGIAWVGQRLGAVLTRGRAAPTALAGALVAAQAVSVLALHPYYGTQFNAIVGSRTGTWALATQWQGEGLDLVARSLNLTPSAAEATVGSHMPTLFRQYFEGATVDIDEDADWYAFGLNNVLRHEGTSDGKPWDYYRRRSPHTVATFGSVEYAWLYPAATGAETEVDYRLGSGINLKGYDLPPVSLHAGDTLPINLYWEATAAPSADYTVFVHLLDSTGKLLSQQDNEPVRGSRPTSGWQAGQSTVDPYDLAIPRDTPPQTLAIAVGMYSWPSGDRLPGYSALGVRLPGDQILLASVRVTRPPISYSSWAARVLAGIVFVAALAVCARSGAPEPARA